MLRLKILSVKSVFISFLLVANWVWAAKALPAEHPWMEFTGCYDTLAQNNVPSLVVSPATRSSIKFAQKVSYGSVLDLNRNRVSGLDMSLFTEMYDGTPVKSLHSVYSGFGTYSQRGSVYVHEISEPFLEADSFEKFTLNAYTEIERLEGGKVRLLVRFKIPEYPASGMNDEFILAPAEGECF